MGRQHAPSMPLHHASDAHTRQRTRQHLLRPPLLSLHALHQHGQRPPVPRLPGAGPVTNPSLRPAQPSYCWAQPQGLCKGCLLLLLVAHAPIVLARMATACLAQRLPATASGLRHHSK
jgi:hypothetical protein